MNFAEYFSLMEASYQQPDQRADTRWEDLRDFWQKYNGSFVKFRDYDGEAQVGKLVGLHDEGVFLVKTRDGQTHDVFIDNILGVQGMQSTPDNRWQPGPTQVRQNRRNG